MGKLFYYYFTILINIFMLTVIIFADRENQQYRIFGSQNCFSKRTSREIILLYIKYLSYLVIYVCPS